MCQPCQFDFKTLIGEVGSALKTACCDVPKVLKAFYLTCPPKCAPETKFDLILPAYAIHFYIYLLSWILTIILYGVAGQIGSAFGLPLINLILTLLTLLWAVIVCKYPTNFCLKHDINLVLWTILMCWYAVAAIINILGSLGVMGFAAYFIVIIIIQIIDLIVLVPIAVWSVLTTIAVCKGSGSTPEVKAADPAQP